MSTSIPAFHVSDVSKAEGLGEVFIASRKDPTSSGTFSVRLSVRFDPGAGDVYPVGAVSIKVDLTDSAKGAFTATSIELINSYGKHNPTIYLTGRCNHEAPAGVHPLPGVRYWLMIADNKRGDGQGTPDVVGFAVHDRDGTRVAYGTGPTRSGDFTILAK